MSALVDHLTALRGRLIEQYKRRPNIDVDLQVAATQLNLVEGMLHTLMDFAPLNVAFGATLDRWGALLNVSRQGMSDADYLAALYIAITLYSSKATPEYMIGLYQTLMRPDYVRYDEVYPATIVLEAVNPAPMFDLATIKSIMLRAKPVGVALFLEETDGGPFFATLEDLASNNDGVGDMNDPTLGGILTSLF